MTAHLSSTWAIDPNHSTVQFKVRHLGISNVNGTFHVFRGEVKSEREDFDQAGVHFEIDVDSIQTHNTDRDTHLKSGQFFDVQVYPTIFFDGSIQKKDEEYELTGDLTIRETKRKIAMEVEFSTVGKGRFGDARAGFEVDGKINRKDFGLDWNLLTETGSFVVGEEIKLHFDIQLIKEKD